ncbi:helix-turn-helix transcriptional regulator [Bradyrhizobium sp.]|uniref:AraC family transcriptional regulator n=1 Tax=Bradyrhizobium sp. TaxID=376 RepID=UPI00239E95BD|nr:helix-turn-helix transcriptional regulator [Bradyrhizobium sp.]MDE2377469.1 AraC family transcriptional regulator [Bradyrhizobium sp.]
MVSVFGATGFEVPDHARLNVRSNFIQLHELALGFWAFGTPARIRFAKRGFAALGLTLRGRGAASSGKQTAAAAVGCPTLASPDQPSEFHYGASLEKVFVRFDAKGLERRLAALLGAPINRTVRFELADFTSQDMLSGLVGLVETLLNQVERRPCVLSPLALRELEEAVTVQLLFTGRHALTGKLQRRPPLTSADPIKRAEQFIEANWQHPITMEVLTDVTGVSARTLFRSFVRTRGYSPMVFARKIRLERAHALLSRPNATTSVTGVALDCGFSNLGRFAHDYASMFGELPSKTLSRSHPAAPGSGRPRDRET